MLMLRDNLEQHSLVSQSRPLLVALDSAKSVITKYAAALSDRVPSKVW